ncbi:pentapeptide repeat-containing protein [Micromonospora sp. NPDC051543]|uniref:pentapeptide repeat-containing protein n=1 Tax=Micromonospora sp. NPDC051543 TaxID=3364287 RepID=UPI0037AE523F
MGAGAGGLIALFVALRRQYVKERVDHADQEYKNRTAEDTKHDAAERRVTELYTKAAEQLGSDKAPVRMAALYALERMGQGNPEHRQTVVNLVCAYLRMPFNPLLLDSTDDAAKVSIEDKERRQQEQQVRLAAQRVLSDHLRNKRVVGVEDGRIFEEDGGAAFWPNMSINLSGAVLLDFDFSSCSVASIRIQDARFYGAAVFSSLISHGLADFSRTHYFCPAFFRKAAFLDSRFRAAQFHYQARFDRTAFGFECDFSQTTFRGPTRFVRVKGSFNFREAKATWKPSVPHVWPDGFGLVKHDSVNEQGWIIRTSRPNDMGDSD